MSMNVTVTTQKRQKHIFGHNFGLNYRRDFVLSVYDNITQGSSDETFTLIFDLDLEMFAQGQFSKKNSNFV